MKYKDELKKAMEYIDNNYANSIFLGQSVCYEGTAMYSTLIDVNINKRIEMPIFEDTQIGLCTGLSLLGFLPISIIPRWNFLICAADQIVNHLDKLQKISSNRYNPKVIIRTSVGSDKPLDPQDQHKSNFSEGFRQMLTNIDIIELNNPEDILPTYKKILKSDKSAILVEFGNYYNEK